MEKYMILSGAAVALGGFAYLNYRRFVPRPQALGSTKCHVTKKVVTIPSGDHTIYGELLLPKEIYGKLPTVIVSHGLGSSGKNARKLVGMSLAMSGFAVYCFDFFGGNLHSKSGGKMWEMSVFTEQDDLNAVIDGIKALDTTDSDRLFLLGESQGGFVTAITAAKRPEDIRAVIEYYPAFCIPEDAQARYGSAENIPEREKFGGSLLGRIYSEKLLGYDVYEVICGYTGPVLILHDDEDRIVDISYGQRAAEIYEHADFVCLPGEIHGFTAEGRKRAALLSYEFLQRTLSDETGED